MQNVAQPSPSSSSRPFTFTGRLRSFAHAFRGVGLMLASQHNAWMHAGATVAVIAAGAFVQLARLEWCLIILAVAGVWMAEALNTAFEFLCDVASPEFHPLVKHAKDVAAGAVLICAIAAVTVGVIVFSAHR